MFVLDGINVNLVKCDACGTFVKHTELFDLYDPEEIRYCRICSKCSAHQALALQVIKLRESVNSLDIRLCEIARKIGTRE